MEKAGDFAIPDSRMPGNTALIEKAMVLLLFGLLLAGVYFILRPFTSGILFGCILGVSGWPVRNWMVRLGLPAGSAAFLMLATLLLLVLLPLSVAAPGLVIEVKALSGRAAEWWMSTPDLPGWIADLPLVGEAISRQWKLLVSGSLENSKQIASFVDPLWKFLSDAAVGLAGSIMQLGISLFIATTIWARGGGAAVLVREALGRLGGDSAARLVDVAGGAVKGVFYGVVGTALIQGGLMALGLLLVGVPAAIPLGFITLLLAISQLGSILINIVWAGSAWWLLMNGASDAAVWFVALWGLAVTFIDNLLKPWLIGARIDMPIMLIMLGVFGGFVALGFLGLFIGPAILAIAYALLQSWRGRAFHQEPRSIQT